MITIVIIDQKKMGIFACNISTCIGIIVSVMSTNVHSTCMMIYGNLKLLNGIDTHAAVSGWNEKYHR